MEEGRIPTQQKHGGTARVLLVLSDRASLAQLARRIAEAGFRVSTADGAHPAIAEMYRAPPDLVLSELALGRTGGAELVRMIRDDPQFRDVPLMVIGGRSHAGAAVRALLGGADDAIRKPFDFDVLVARIARQLDRARAVRELREANAVLDARIVTRAIELGDIRDRLASSEAERLRLERLVRAKAA